MGARATLEAPAGEAVRVLVFDIAPGERVEQIALIDARGARHLAESYTASTHATGSGGAGGGIVLGVQAGSSTGVKPYIGLNVPILDGSAAVRSRRVSARVPIPDAGAFRSDARRWRIEVVYTDVTGARRSLSFPVR